MPIKKTDLEETRPQSCPKDPISATKELGSEVENLLIPTCPTCKRRLVGPKVDQDKILTAEEAGRLVYDLLKDIETWRMKRPNHEVGKALIDRLVDVGEVRDGRLILKLPEVPK